MSESQKQFLDLLDSGIGVAQIQRDLNLSDSEVQANLRSLLIDLHFATFEQLYLALYDSRFGSKST